jgi:Mono-functional DNA-alkylating methyl methanesulfonate N-term
MNFQYIKKMQIFYLQLSVMSDGLVFLGTSSGPASLLIKLRDSSRNPETKFYYDVIQKFPALGSILELHVVKSAEKHGLDETSLLACTSDTFGTSLTSIRSGINLEDPVQIPLAGIQKAWYVSSIGKGDFEEKQTFILTDFTTTRYCTLEKEDFLEVALSGDLNLTARTIFFHQMSESVCLQVTPIA